VPIIGRTEAGLRVATLERPGPVVAARLTVGVGSRHGAARGGRHLPCRRRAAVPVAAARAVLEIAEQAKSIGPLAELEQKVVAEPLNHQARFDLAVALNAKGQREDAVKHLIEVVKRDRKWNDDGARKQLVQFFEAWGPTDPATVEGRKRLSSILFS